jgi:hypothetical protein
MLSDVSPLRTPVALFIFNRPALTAEVMSAIRQVRPERLLVVADGPRSDRTADGDLCRQARQAAEQVDWPCNVQMQYSAGNLGCKVRLASGLDWVFGQAESAIVLEDDCVPEPSFFAFCEQLLARYRDEPRVHMISGTNLLGGKCFSPDSYYFSRFYHVWGWATWARAWRHYDVDMRRWGQLRDTDWVDRYLPTPEMARQARFFFDETFFHDRFTTWDYQWVLAGWLQGAHAIVPSVNLVRNTGFGATGAHLRNADSPLAALPTQPMGFPLRHPAEVAVLEAADAHEWARLNPQTPTGPARWRQRIARALRFGRH